MPNSNLVVINGSYHRNGVTSRCLLPLTDLIASKHHLTPRYFFVDDNIRACVSCRSADCVFGCRFKDQLQTIGQAISEASHVLIGSPVYLDFPTPKLLALLSRFNSYAEKSDRYFFEGKQVHLHANGYCSGTKAVIGVLMRACEMLGFDLGGRSTTEYIEIWRDQKIRGGMRREEFCLISPEGANWPNEDDRH